MVPQVHRLARRANATKTLTFTNKDNEDLDVLYVDLKRDKDYAKLEHEYVQPAGVDANDKEDDPQDDLDYELDNDSDDDDSDDDGDNKDNEIEAEHDDGETLFVAQRG